MTIGVATTVDAIAMTATATTTGGDEFHSLGN
jgi:hypothetical protein